MVIGVYTGVQRTSLFVYGHSKKLSRYAQLTYAPSSAREWEPGYHLFQIPQIIDHNSIQERSGVVRSTWYQQKLKNAIRTIYKALQKQRFRFLVPVLSATDIERLFLRYIDKGEFH